MTRSQVPTQQNVCSMRVSCKRDPTPFPPSVRDQGETWRADKLPPCLPKGLHLIQTRCSTASSSSFVALIQMKRLVVSCKSRILWTGFIRYYNLCFLQGQRGQRFLLGLISWPRRSLTRTESIQFTWRSILGMVFVACNAAQLVLPEMKQRTVLFILLESNLNSSAVARQSR